MSNAQSRNFFDANGKPLGSDSTCPTCQRRRTFTYKSSGSTVHVTSAECGHSFTVPIPHK